MKSLNKSLPKSSAKQPPEQLLSFFKAAALSVTNLYKTAKSEEDQARRQGYQEALDELLHFLDKEGLGLGDGEGWKVRQWATERYDGTPPSLEDHDSDDDAVDSRSQARDNSPTIKRKSSREEFSARQPTPSTSPIRTVSTASQTLPPIQESHSTISRPEIFSFTTPISYPQEAEMEISEPADNLNPPYSQTPVPPNSSTQTMRVGVVPRGARTPHRSGARSTRHSTKSTHATRSLGPGAGSKRMMTFGDYDYFDIGGSGDKDASGGGGKRGRIG